MQQADKMNSSSAARAAELHPEARMLSFLKRLFRPSRNVYAYHDGRSKRYADPLTVLRSLEVELGDDWPSAVARAAEYTTPPAHFPAQALAEWHSRRREIQEKLVTVSRRVFGVQGLESGGLTEAESLALLVGYMEWLTRIVEDNAPFAQSPGSMDAPASPPPSK